MPGYSSIFLCIFFSHSAFFDLPTCWFRWIFEGLMVNQWGQYDTDDSATGTGYGNVLSQYGFEGFNKNNSFWIILLYIFFFSGLNYLALQPPAKRLIHMDDAVDPESVKREDKLRNSSIISLKRNLSTVAGITESLISRGDEEAGDVQIGQQTTYDVAWYRQSTGNVALSRGCRLVFKDIHYAVPDKKDPKVSSELPNYNNRVCLFILEMLLIPDHDPLAQKCLWSR